MLHIMKMMGEKIMGIGRKILVIGEFSVPKWINRNRNENRTYSNQTNLIQL
jgi:hypothetical protein